MSTPQSPPGDNGPADPTRPWLQQTDASPSTSASQPPPPQQPQKPTAGQPRPRQPPTLTDAVQTIKPADFLTFHQAPCSRTGLLTGIGAGAAVGAIRWIMGLPIPRAANWAVGTGVLAAVGQYEYCQLRRQQEREKVKRVVEVYAAKQAREKREKEEEERRVREGEAKRKEEEERRRGWRFW
ncbi:hypothetical protein C8A01DRAFT_15371 [Parachaetomium inaequale]|uniref:Cytochrome c oxidase assembly protein COX20, mitochondrial n=1 Tax=Parachaetomium inaequale TaxID=2588326 RepID=A0AAN6PKP6_9PEZI|nr:hypothetical protein C8A01DRAFT_15371 [Parachaetomium inaequale]